MDRVQVYTAPEILSSGQPIDIQGISSLARQAYKARVTVTYDLNDRQPPEYVAGTPKAAPRLRLSPDFKTDNKMVGLTPDTVVNRVSFSVLNSLARRCDIWTPVRDQAPQFPGFKPAVIEEPPKRVHHITATNERGTSAVDVYDYSGLPDVDVGFLSDIVNDLAATSVPIPDLLPGNLAVVPSWSGRREVLSTNKLQVVDVNVIYDIPQANRPRMESTLWEILGKPQFTSEHVATDLQVTTTDYPAGVWGIPAAEKVLVEPVSIYED